MPKAGNYDACIVGGVKSVIMFITDPENAPEVMAENSSAFSQSNSPFAQPVSTTVMGILGAALLVFTLLFRPRKKKSTQPEYVIRNRNDAHWIAKTLLINIAIPAAWIWSQLTYDPPVTVVELLIAMYIFIIILLLERRHETKPLHRFLFWNGSSCKARSLLQVASILEGDLFYLSFSIPVVQVV
jgi:hypothetical protein